VLTIVGNVAPTLTKVNTIPGFENEPLNISFAQLAPPNSDLSVIAGHTGEFQIVSVQNGTLTITHNSVTTTVVSGTPVIFGPGDSLTWTPPTNVSVPTAAFSVIGYDPQNAVIAPALAASTTPVPVVVNLGNLSPIMTHISTLMSAGKNSQFAISFGSLMSNSDAHAVDGQPLQFLVQSIDPGTNLQIIKAGTSTLVPVVPYTGIPIGPTTTVFGPGDTLVWTPPLNVTGSAVNAFKVVAYDAFEAANHPSFAVSGAVEVTVNVLNAVAPTLSTINTPNSPRFVPTFYSFTDIMNNSTATVAAGDTLGFRVESIISGTLSFTHNGITATAVPGQTMIRAGDSFTWISAPGATGVTAAFTIAAIDLNNGLTSLPQQVNFNLINKAPTLTTVSTLQVADQQSPFNISYAVLLGASDAKDKNNDVIQFKINSVQNGTLTITHNGATATVTAGASLDAATTAVQPGDTLTWTPANGISGTAVNAFTVSAFDGSLASASPVQVTVNVRPFGTAFNLTGVWTIGGGLARINQNGPNLTLVNQAGVGSAASFIAGNQIVAPGFSNKVGTIDTTTADDGRISWSDGTVWLRISLGGTWSFNGKLAYITQNGSALSLIDTSGMSSSGTITSPTQVTVPALGSQPATFGNGTLTLPNGQVWTKLDLSPDFTSSLGGKTHVIKNGPNNLIFVNNVGQTFSGNFTDPTHVVAAGLGTGAITNGSIVWSSGETWFNSLTIFGTHNGSGTVSIAVSQNFAQTTFTFTDTNNSISHASLSGNTLIFTDGPLQGMTGVRGNGVITLSNGTTLDNFDFNALNALFEI